MELSTEQKEVLNMAKKGTSFFLTGKAVTWKSTLVQVFRIFKYHKMNLTELIKTPMMGFISKKYSFNREKSKENGIEISFDLNDDKFNFYLDRIEGNIAYRSEKGYIEEISKYYMNEFTLESAVYCAALKRFICTNIPVYKFILEFGQSSFEIKPNFKALDHFLNKSKLIKEIDSLDPKKAYQIARCWDIEFKFKEFDLFPSICTKLSE